MGLPRIRNNIYEICASLFVLCLIIPVISGKLNLKHTFLKICPTKFWRTHGSALYDAVKCRLPRTMRITYAEPDILHILIGYTLLVPIDDVVALVVSWYSCAIVDLIIKYFYHNSLQIEWFRFYVYKQTFIPIIWCWIYCLTFRYRLWLHLSFLQRWWSICKRLL